MIRSLICLSSLMVLVSGQSCSTNATAQLNGFCPIGYNKFGNLCCHSDYYSASPCVDLVKSGTNKSDCPNVTAYCKNSAYRKTMQQQCPRTCSWCLSQATTTTTTTSSTCVDKINPNTLVSDCPDLKNYCFYSAYRTLMRTECPYTCGFCS